MNEVSQAVKNRLSAFIEYKGLTNAAFEKKCGLSNGYIRNFKGNLGVKKLDDILTSFPELSKDWLLFGTGEMLNTSINKEAAEELSQPQNTMVEKPEGNKMIDTLLFLVESQRKDIETLIQIIKEKDQRIDELLDELLIYKGDKGGNATSADSSSVADAI